MDFAASTAAVERADLFLQSREFRLRLSRSHSKSWNAAPGIERHRDFLFMIATAAMEQASIVACGVSEYAKFGRRSGHPEPTLAVHNAPHELSELRPRA
jgi:hypothetical protein